MAEKRDKNEVTLTARDVAKFFGAPDPNLQVRVLDQGYEDGDLGQWYGYLITFSVIQADRWIYVEWEDRQTKIETLRQFRRKTMPWLP